MSDMQPADAVVWASQAAPHQFISNDNLKIVLDGCGVETLPAIQQGLRQTFGLDYEDLPLAYPFSSYITMLEWLRGKLYSADSVEVGYQKIGQATIHRFLEGGFSVGQCMGAGASLLGVDLQLPMFFQQLCRVLDFIEIVIVTEAPGYLNFVLGNIVWPSDLMVGMLQAMLEAAEAKAVQISYRSLSVKNTEFEIKWQA
jgi:uncharacterized protein (TIGR02265 family)